MRYHLSIVIKALKTVFQNKIYVLGIAVTALLVFISVITVPLLTVPGNDLWFQLSIMPFRDYSAIAFLCILTGISIMLNLYVFQRENAKKVQRISLMSINGVIGFTSSFFGSVTCVACSSTILGFLGLGIMTMLLQYRLVIMLLSGFFILLSIYFTSRKILNFCNVCKVS